MNTLASARAKAAGLSLWSGAVEPVPLAGGITNRNFVVADKGERFVVRVADDIPVHGIMRFNELAASRAAHAAGVSPEVVHAEPGALVLRFIDGETFDAAAVRKADAEGRILPLLRRVHDDMRKYFRGPVLAFWVFQSMRGYGIALREGGSRMAAELPRYSAINETPEAAVGPFTLIRYALGLLSTRAAAAALGRAAGCRAALIMLPFPDAAHDVDKPADLAFAEARLAARGDGS